MTQYWNLYPSLQAPAVPLGSLRQVEGIAYAVFALGNVVAIVVVVVDTRPKDRADAVVAVVQCSWVLGCWKRLPTGQRSAADLLDFLPSEWLGSSCLEVAMYLQTLGSDLLRRLGSVRHGRGCVGFQGCVPFF